MRKCTNIRNSIIIRNITLTVRIATSIRQSSTQRQAIVRNAFKLAVSWTRIKRDTGAQQHWPFFGRRKFWQKRIWFMSWSSNYSRCSSTSCTSCERIYTFVSSVVRSLARLRKYDNSVTIVTFPFSFSVRLFSPILSFLYVSSFSPSIPFLLLHFTGFLFLIPV